ncbi:MAG: T9SS type A sorting domain-containing protein [Fibrobacteres bacterium]|nr:T9SS type A sorting domain-containing protein [Fibrobacterota bacterium]
MRIIRVFGLISFLSLLDSAFGAWDPSDHTAGSWLAVTTTPHYYTASGYENDFVVDYKVGVNFYGFGHKNLNTNQIWLHTLASDTFLQTTPFHRPPKCCGAQISYDPVTGMAYKMGGGFHAGLRHGYGFISDNGRGLKAMDNNSTLNEMWAFNGATRQWYNMRPIKPWPPANPEFVGYNTNFAYARDYGLSLLSGRMQNDYVWAYHAYTNRWYSFAPKGTVRPTGMIQMPTSAYDLKNHKLVKIGGAASLGTYPTWGTGGLEDSNTYTFDIATSSWGKLNLNNPPPVSVTYWSYGGVSSVFDEWSQKIVAVSAFGENTSSFDMSTDSGWKAVTVTGRPTAGANQGRGFQNDPVNNVNYLLSGGTYSDKHPVYAFRFLNTVPAMPFAPINLKAVTSPSGVVLTWDASSQGAQSDSFYVYKVRWGAKPGAFEQVAITATKTWSDNPSVSDTVFYSYSVAAKNSSGLSLVSEPVYTCPVRPLGLVATVESATSVGLRWKNNRESDLAGYNIYRAQGAYPSGKSGFVKLNSALLTNPEFADWTVDLSNGIIRHYVVTAVNKLGQESGFSPLAHTIPDAPGGPWTNATTNRAAFGKMFWHPPANGGVVKYQICDNGYRQASNGDTTNVIAELDSSARSYDFTKVGDRGYVVRAVNVLGQYGFCSDLIPIGDNTSGQYYFLDGRGMTVPVDTFWNGLDKTVAGEKAAVYGQCKNVMLSVSPNPFTYRTKLALSGVEGNTVASIFNVEGRLVKKIDVIKGFATINSLNMPSGIYAVQVKAAGKLYKTKVILSR